MILIDIVSSYIYIYIYIIIVTEDHRREIIEHI